MALDEPRADDAVVDTNGITFMMDNQTTDLVRQSGGLVIDYVDENYRRGYLLKLGSAKDCNSGGCSGCG